MHQKVSSFSVSYRLKQKYLSRVDASFASPPRNDSSRGSMIDYRPLPVFFRSGRSNTSQVNIQDLVIKTPDAQIGSGSFGDVWKGTRSGSPCAVKVLHGVNLFLPLHGSVNSEKQEKFWSECKFLKQLKHPNIVRHLQTYIHPESGTPLLAMELMDENLTSFLERCSETSGNKLTKCIQMKICTDVAKALNYLHYYRIVHRDLSSHNILLSGSTRTVSCNRISAKVSDFGISRLIDNERFDKTLSTIAPGTKGYMPPESWNCQGKYDEKFDIFSFGVLVLQTITMLRPDPSDRYSSGGIVPEVKRRKDHFRQIKSHTLEHLVSSCLRDNKVARPSASEICCILQQQHISCTCTLHLLDEYEDLLDLL